MGRLDKIYARLDNLESQLLNIIKRELEIESKGNLSLYLIRQGAGPGWTSKRKSDKETNEAEKLENEIHSLRDKLNLTHDEGPLLILSNYIKLKKDKSLLNIDKNGFSKSIIHQGIANKLIEKYYKA